MTCSTNYPEASTLRGEAQAGDANQRRIGLQLEAGFEQDRPWPCGRIRPARNPQVSNPKSSSPRCQLEPLGVASLRMILGA